MGEPSLPANHLLPSLPDDSLASLVKRQFPGAIISKDGDTYVLATVHGVGSSEREAMQNSLETFNDMARDGRSLRTMLDDVIADLKESGMSRLRHDSLMEILDICSNALNGGVITNTIPWIMIPSYNREITALRTRVSNRLGIAGQDTAMREELQRKGLASKNERTPRTHTSGTLRLLGAFQQNRRSHVCNPERVVHCKKYPYDMDTHQFQDAGILYIGRECNGFPQSKWANPYAIGWDGTREEVLDNYEKFVLASPALLADLKELDGKTLACWCAPLACHGDVLIRLREDQVFKRNAFRT